MIIRHRRGLARRRFRATRSFEFLWGSEGRGVPIWSVLLAFVLAATSARCANAEDWPTWRFDAARTARSPQAPLQHPRLQWTLRLPPQTPAYQNPRLQFDRGYEPVVAGKRMLIASSRDDSLTAYDTDSGQPRWRVFAAGPIRFAPVIWRERAYFGADDGVLYCVSLDDGKLLWKFRAAPRVRKLLGNGRLISVWPVRGGPVAADGKVYFAAGVWSFEGVFVYALDAISGRVDWTNDRLGYLYGSHPHGTKAIGGLTPQGYLVVDGDELIVPCSAAYPARLNRQTGEVIDFALPAKSRVPGGWFAAVEPALAKAARRGELILDDVVNRQRHEDNWRTGASQSGASRSMSLGEKIYRFDDGWEGVTGKIHTIVAADRKMFVVTEDGAIRCFAEGDEAAGRPASDTRDTSDSSDSRDTPEASNPSSSEPSSSARASSSGPVVDALLAAGAARRGYALVLGLRDGELLQSLMDKSNLHVIGIDSDSGRLRMLRERFAARGCYGTRVALLQAEFADFQPPPYVAQVITSEAPDRWLGESPETAAVESSLQALRPYGGIACFALSDQQQRALSDALAKSSLAGQVQVRREAELVVVERAGALPGSTDYQGQWKPSEDALVRAPLGVLWFDDALGHFKRSPQPHFVAGVMISYPKRWLDSPLPRADGEDYPLLPPVLTDMYTGRRFAPEEMTELRQGLAPIDPEKREPSQYRPPSQKDAWSPAAPRPGQRTNPLTGKLEDRTFPKDYGCDGGLDYGLLYTMRSGTAAFYDKTCESGTIYISGPRSGCTNSVIPAGGLLNVPYFYEGCTCSYPLPVGLALFSRPESHEQWASWGGGKPSDIQRVGVNFGAPGDRMTRDGTLWLDYPNVGGPSPELEAVVQPAEPRYFYRHSLRMQEGQGWPWVAASGAEGLEAFTLANLKPGRYRVRLFFAEPDPDHRAGDRVQDVRVQGIRHIENLDLAATAGGPLRGIVKELRGIEVAGELRLELVSRRGRTQISGVEILPEEAADE